MPHSVHYSEFFDTGPYFINVANVSNSDSNSAEMYNKQIVLFSNMIVLESRWNASLMLQMIFTKDVAGTLLLVQETESRTECTNVDIETNQLPLLLCTKTLFHVGLTMVTDCVGCTEYQPQNV